MFLSNKCQQETKDLNEIMQRDRSSHKQHLQRTIAASSTSKKPSRGEAPRGYSLRFTLY